jgi:uncharacterized protein
MSQTWAAPLAATPRLLNNHEGCRKYNDGERMEAASDCAKRPYRVLSLDGGGIRGLYTASVLKLLTERAARMSKTRRPEQNLDFGAQFNLISGTSTGAILATALAKGVALEKVISLYKAHAREIFSRPMPLKDGSIRSSISMGSWLLDTAFNPANNGAALRKALQKVLGEQTLGELYASRQIALAIPSVNAETRQGWVFKTPHGERLTRDNHFKLVDVCMASAAAPIYFPLHRVKDPSESVETTYSFVDGGLWANNPILVALTEALEFAGDRKIEILSVGTCTSRQSKPISADQALRGSFGWRGGAEVLSTALEAQAFTTAYVVKSLVKALAHRVTLHRLVEPVPSPEEAKHLALDAVGDLSIEMLQKLAFRAVDLNISELTTSGGKPEHEMTLHMLSNLNTVKEDRNGL